MERRRKGLPKKAARSSGPQQHFKEEKDNADEESFSENEEDSDRHKADGYCHFNDSGDVKSFSINLFGHELNLIQDPATRVLGHGAVVWDAAVVFAKYMEHDPKQFPASALAGKRVLELGSGCGLAGLALMMKGADVTFTDLEPVVAALTTDNIANVYAELTTKGSGATPTPLICPRAIPLDWTAYESLGESGILSPPYDFVLLTDCVFSPLLAAALIGVITFACGPRSTVYCCHEIRDEEANAKFLEELGKKFHYKKIARSKLHPDYKNSLIEVILGKPIRTSSSSSSSLSSKHTRAVPVVAEEEEEEVEERSHYAGDQETTSNC